MRKHPYNLKNPQDVCRLTERVRREDINRNQEEKVPTRCFCHHYRVHQQRHLKAPDPSETQELTKTANIDATKEIDAPERSHSIGQTEEWTKEKAKGAARQSAMVGHRTSHLAGEAMP
ncbi:hypothetical protein Nepgr_030900 [Nepenthes gracilis]|uniref:Uncharacterized protein n=1 Tax=Nepenthes gracilis TaxID=150966 RepID=A0AAD3THV7_NEPGR|nr:hypothetical protein Nepgr_030900 [Nepenthes gracilis]